MDVTNTLEVIEDIRKIAVDGIGIAKTGFSFASLGTVLSMLNDAHDIVNNMNDVLPELQDLDAAESAQLASAGYGLVKDVIAALRA